MILFTLPRRLFGGKPTTRNDETHALCLMSVAVVLATVPFISPA